MAVAIAITQAPGFPDRASNLWMSRGVVITLLLTAFAVMALTERGEAATCEGTPLAIAELTLPDLTHPA